MPTIKLSFLRVQERPVWYLERKKTREKTKDSAWELFTCQFLCPKRLHILKIKQEEKAREAVNADFEVMGGRTKC